MVEKKSRNRRLKNNSLKLIVRPAVLYLKRYVLDQKSSIVGVLLTCIQILVVARPVIVQIIGKYPSTFDPPDYNLM